MRAVRFPPPLWREGTPTLRRLPSPPRLPVKTMSAKRWRAQHERKHAELERDLQKLVEALVDQGSLTLFEEVGNAKDHE